RCHRDQLQEGYKAPKKSYPNVFGLRKFHKKGLNQGKGREIEEKTSQIWGEPARVSWEE
ncbi:unnamed protein product, partial [Prunus brigantina]